MVKKDKKTAEVTEQPKKESKPKPEPRACVCGCGNETKGGLFVSGHDGRVHGWFASVKSGDFLAEGLRTQELRDAFSRWDGNGGLKQAFGV